MKKRTLIYGHSYSIKNCIIMKNLWSLIFRYFVFWSSIFDTRKCSLLIYGELGDCFHVSPKFFYIVPFGTGSLFVHKLSIGYICVAIFSYLVLYFLIICINPWPWYYTFKLKFFCSQNLCNTLRLNYILQKRKCHVLLYNFIKQKVS